MYVPARCQRNIKFIMCSAQLIVYRCLFMTSYVYNDYVSLKTLCIFENYGAMLYNVFFHDIVFIFFTMQY